MLTQFENEYMALHWEYQRLTWQNYFEDAHHDLNTLDDQFYHLAKKYDGKIKNVSRKALIADFLIKRTLIDKDKKIAAIRNKIDEYDSYCENISDTYQEYERRCLIAKRMKKDVLTLIMLRNQLAKEFGFLNYPDAVYHHDEMKQEKVSELLQLFLNENLEVTKNLIQKYDISLKNWFQDLKRIGSKKISYSSEQLFHEIKQKFGFNTDINIYFHQTRLSGMASKLKEDDIRIILRPVESLNDISILFHELGHALYYSTISEKGLYEVLPPSLDEVMAVVFEYIAPLIVLPIEDQLILEELRTIEYTRCTISALFEEALWQDPEQADLLYKHYYEKFGLSVKDSSLWAIDSFRSIDPVYIHNYVLGAILAKKLIGFFNKEYGKDYIKWGNFLKQLMKNGRKGKFSDFMNLQN